MMQGAATQALTHISSATELVIKLLNRRDISRLGELVQRLQDSHHGLGQFLVDLSQAVGNLSYTAAYQHVNVVKMPL